MCFVHLLCLLVTCPRVCVEHVFADPITCQGNHSPIRPQFFSHCHRPALYPSGAMPADLTKKAKKLIRPARKVAGKRVQFAWRRRKPGVAPSYADKAAMKQRRDAENQALEKALEEADLALWDIAEELHKQFPKHPVKYYYQRIMQRSNLKRQRRKVSL